MSSVGLALIVKNEEENLPHLLESIRGCFDEVVLVDTGSTDKTLEVFAGFVEAELAQNSEFKFEQADFEWCNDFSAARRFAQSLQTTEWQVWADADDVIVGAERIRELCTTAPPELAAYICGYNYTQINGQCVCYLKRERIVRAGTGEWIGHVHEAQVVNGPASFVPAEVVEWVHRKSPEQAVKQATDERNLKILREWVEKEPQNTRVLAYVGTEEAARGEHEVAIEHYERYLEQNPDWHEEHAQVCRKMARSLFVMNRHKEARDKAFRAMLLVPDWPDSWLTLAEYHMTIGEFDKAVYWLDRVLERGVPDTVLIVSPIDYTWLPMKLKAVCLDHLGRSEEALGIIEQAAAILLDEDVAGVANNLRNKVKRDKTAETFILAMQNLVAHDEQAKALTLMDCLPYYAQDHPAVVQARSQLRERTLWLDGGYAQHYETGGSKPEDFIADDQVDQLGDALPRCAFLLRGVREQIGERQSITTSG